jgi:hypothetical protein
MLRPPRRKARLCVVHSQLATTIGLRCTISLKTKRPDRSRGAIFYSDNTTKNVMPLSRQNLIKIQDFANTWAARR